MSHDGRLSRQQHRHPGQWLQQGPGDKPVGNGAPIPTSRRRATRWARRGTAGVGRAGLQRPLRPLPRRPR